MANGVSKDPSFHTDFKNVNFILVKSALKKVFARKIGFLGKTILGALFTRSNVYILNQYKKTDFFIPHSTYSKGKGFIS
jgi:hypothetical protein